MKTDKIYIRVEPELKERLRAQAEKEYMSMSAYILKVLRKELNKNKR